MPKYDRERLYGGNWKERPETGEFPFHWFDDSWFENWPVDPVVLAQQAGSVIGSSAVFDRVEQLLSQGVETR